MFKPLSIKNIDNKPRCGKTISETNEKDTLMAIFKTYKEAFLHRLKHNMESPVVEHAEAIKDVFCEWLSEADDEIAELKKEIEKLKGEQ